MKKVAKQIFRILLWTTVFLLPIFLCVKFKGEITDNDWIYIGIITFCNLILFMAYRTYDKCSANDKKDATKHGRYVDVAVVVMAFIYYALLS